MKTWTLELTEDELISLAKICCDWAEAKLASGHITAEELLTLHHIQHIDDKLPEEGWFSEEARL